MVVTSEALNEHQKKSAELTKNICIRWKSYNQNFIQSEFLLTV